MVSNCIPNDDLRTRAITSRLRTSSIQEQKTPTTQETAADGMSAVRRSLEKRGILQSACCQYRYVIMEGFNSVPVSMLY